MIEVKIKNLSNVQTHGAVFETEIEANEWLSKQNNMRNFGELERIKNSSQCSQEELALALETIPATLETQTIPAVLDENGIEISPESTIEVEITPERVRLPQMFSVEIIDLSSQVLAETVAQKWTEFRADRDAKLSACDFTQLADAPLTSAEKTEYRGYRTYLRGAPDLHNDTTILTATVKTFEEYKAGLL